MMMILRRGSVNRTLIATVIKIIAKAMDQMQRVSNVSKIATVKNSAIHVKRINVKGAGDCWEGVDTKIKIQFEPIFVLLKIRIMLLFVKFSIIYSIFSNFLGVKSEINQ